MPALRSTATALAYILNIGPDHATDFMAIRPIYTGLGLNPSSLTLEENIIVSNFKDL